MATKAKTTKTQPEQKVKDKDVIKGVKEHDPLAEARLDQANKEAIRSEKKPPVKKLFEELGDEKGTTVSGSAGLELQKGNEAMNRPIMTADEREWLEKLRAVATRYLDMVPAIAMSKKEQFRVKAKINIWSVEVFEKLFDDDMDIVHQLYTSETVDYGFLERFERRYKDISP